MISSRWRVYLLALGCGLLAAASQPPLSWWWILGIALPGLYWLWSGVENSRRAFWIGWFAGLGYFGASLIWIAEPFLVEPEKFAWLIPVAVPAMAGGMALFWGAGFWLAAIIARGRPPPNPPRERGGLISRSDSPSPLSVYGEESGVGPRQGQSHWTAPFALAGALAGMEWLRGNVLTGFPWSLLGYAWVETPAMQLAAVVGIYGVTLWTVLAGFLLGHAVRLTGLSDKVKLGVAALVLLAIPTAYGWDRAFTLGFVIDKSGRPKPPQIGLVQPNVAQKDKWQPHLREAHLKDLLAKTRELSDKGADVVIWPEAATPYQIDQAPQLRKLIADALKPGGILLAGGVRFETGIDQQRAYNSIIAVGHDATVLDIYDKQHLVPFGERMPFHDFLTGLGIGAFAALPGGFTTGKSRERSMTLGSLPPFVPMICYEAIFPAEVMRRAAKGDWMVQVTNDAWFGNWIGPYQHLAMARVRAIERGLPLARAANTGVSAMIDAKGRILASLPLNESGVLLHPLPRRGQKTLYARYEDILFSLGLFLCIALGAVGRRRTKS